MINGSYSKFIIFLMAGLMIGISVVPAQKMGDVFTAEWTHGVSDNWQLLNYDTLTPLNESYNVSIGKNATTDFKLYVNGSGYFAGNLIIDEGLEASTIHSHYGLLGNYSDIQEYIEIGDNSHDGYIGFDGITDFLMYWNGAQNYLDMGYLGYTGQINLNDNVNISGILDMYGNKIINGNLSEYTSDKVYIDDDKLMINATEGNIFDQDLNTTDENVTFGTNFTVNTESGFFNFRNTTLGSLYLPTIETDAIAMIMDKGLFLRSTYSGNQAKLLFVDDQDNNKNWQFTYDDDDGTFALDQYGYNNEYFKMNTNMSIAQNKGISLQAYDRVGGFPVWNRNPSYINFILDGTKNDPHGDVTDIAGQIWYDNVGATHGINIDSTQGIYFDANSGSGEIGFNGQINFADDIELGFGKSGTTKRSYIVADERGLFFNANRWGVSPDFDYPNRIQFNDLNYQTSFIVNASHGEVFSVNKTGEHVNITSSNTRVSGNLTVTENLSTTNITSNNDINIKPSNDLDDYIRFSTGSIFADVPSIEIIGGTTVYVKSDQAYTYLSMVEDMTHQMWFGWDNGNDLGSMSSTHDFAIQTGDYDDYIEFQTSNNIPVITTVGGCDLNLSSSSGIVNVSGILTMDKLIIPSVVGSPPYVAREVHYIEANSTLMIYNGVTDDWDITVFS